MEGKRKRVFIGYGVTLIHPKIELYSVTRPSLSLSLVHLEYCRLEETFFLPSVPFTITYLLGSSELSQSFFLSSFQTPMTPVSVAHDYSRFSPTRPIGVCNHHRWRFSWQIRAKCGWQHHWRKRKLDRSAARSQLVLIKLKIYFSSQIHSFLPLYFPSPLHSTPLRLFDIIIIIGGIKFQQDQRGFSGASDYQKVSECRLPSPVWDNSGLQKIFSFSSFPHGC